MVHFHHCPECYEKVLCELNCTIEPDLQDGDREFGSHCVCEHCAAQVKEPTKEWWDIYHGFKKRKQ
jgi:hypothetical protein